MTYSTNVMPGTARLIVGLLSSGAAAPFLRPVAAKSLRAGREGWAWFRFGTVGNIFFGRLFLSADFTWPFSNEKGRVSRF
jgi:hypothetical protein